HFEKIAPEKPAALEPQGGYLPGPLWGGETNVGTFLRRFGGPFTDFLIGGFRKNFLGVHTKLAKGVGFVAPRKGPAARFVLGDNLLKALVLANTPVRGQMTFDGFLGQLYKNYGLVIGPEEANLAGLFDRHRINA